MVEREFEADLERMFNTPPASLGKDGLADNEAFTRRVTGKLNTSWRLRAFGIATAGAVGGLIAVSQTLGSGFSLQLAEASDRSVARVGQVEQAVSQFDSFAGLDFAAIGLNGNLVAMMGITLVLGMAAMAMRLIDET